MTQAHFPAPVEWSQSGYDWEDLARAHRTPFFLFDADFIAARLEAVRAAFANLVQVYYAVKANPNLGLLRAVLPAANGVDISSVGELFQARLAGYDPETMSFAGPAKNSDELAEAIRAGVGGISVESLRELDHCAAIARRLGSSAQILLRVNPAAANRAYGLKMGGKPVQFGIDEEHLPAAEQRVRAHAEHVTFRGIHVYVGSQCFDATAAAEATANALRIADDIERRSGLVSTKINLGGGFGVSHAGSHRELDLNALAQALVPTLRAQQTTSPGCQLIFELGRYLTAPAGIYVTRVVDTKISRGKLFVVCDGGLNHNLAAAGTFGTALRTNFPVYNLSGNGNRCSITCHIAGPSCNPTDLLGVDASIGAPEPGDLIGVGHCGSYGLTASPILFLGRPTPVELVRSGAGVTVGRKSHSIGDFN